MANTIVINEEMKELVNRAIIKVCTTQFKKDAKAEHELLEGYGYQIYKLNGRFSIQSPNRTVSIEYVGNYRHNYKVVFGYYHVHYKYFKTYEDLFKFDFVNCLNTPINTEYYNLKQYEEGWGGINDKHAKYEQIRNKLHNLKWNITWYNREVEDVQKKIESLQKQILSAQKDMLRYKENAVKADVELVAYRKELGLA